MPETDVLSEVLGQASLRGEVFCRTRLGEGIELSFPSGQAHFHVVERGTCHVHVPTLRRAFRAATGDVLVFVEGVGHSVATTASPSRRHALFDAIPTHFDPEARTLDLSDGDPAVELICGRFDMDEVGRQGLASALPPVLQVRTHARPLADWLTSTLRLLAAEATDTGPGSGLARSRLMDLVLVGILRQWLEDGAEAEASWLTGLRDPVVGRALQLLHASPAHPWSVPELASRVGLSRSPFAARFKDQVGASPMRYLTSWRMKLAVRELRRGATVGETADAVGYQSATAFSRVFRRELGTTPGSFRRPTDRA
jgi:AraC-like DNA-binding protein